MNITHGSLYLGRKPEIQQTLLSLLAVPKVYYYPLKANQLSSAAMQKIFDKLGAQLFSLRWREGIQEMISP